MIRVLVERHLKEGKRKELLPLLMELRAAALHYPGYVTGETLSSATDPSIISVLSTWQSLEDWKSWEKTETRIKIYEKIEPLLAEKPKISIYQVMAVEEK